MGGSPAAAHAADLGHCGCSRSVIPAGVSFSREPRWAAFEGEPNGENWV